MAEYTLLEAVTRALSWEMNADENVVVLGEEEPPGRILMRRASVGSTPCHQPKVGEQTLLFVRAVPLRLGL